MSDKMTVAVIFGGQSSEHDVSCVSGATVMKALDQTKYDLILVGITKEGKWLLVDSIEAVENGSWKNGTVSAIISPDATDHGLLIMEQGQVRKQKVDVIFPVLHGMYGEDGTIQGVFEMAGIPYVGCGVFGSAVSMDKRFTKVLVEGLGIRQAAFEDISRMDMIDMEACLDRVEKSLPYPVFVKPSKAGSSVGVNKATDRASLKYALEVAAKEDMHVLVEETIVGREVECAVLGGYEPKASGVGEVLAADEWYSFDAKYNNAESRTDIHPEFPEGKEDEIRDAAVKIFKRLDAFGLSRVDFFLTTDTNEVVFNEINTLPGFTPISMYPMLWEAKGIDKQTLTDMLIEEAYKR